MSVRRDLTGQTVRTYGLMPTGQTRPTPPPASAVNLRGCDQLTDREQVERYAEYAELDGGTE